MLEAVYRRQARVLGVDVARYGSDSSVIFPRQGLVAFTPKVYRNLDTMAIAGQVARVVESWKPASVFVDVGGVGAGVVDRLLQLQVQVVPVDFGSKALEATRFENKRAEMWWEMAEWTKSGALPTNTDLQRDLTSPRITWRNKRGRVQLESKDELRARGLPSPDLADALACTFAMRVMVPDALAEKPAVDFEPLR